MANPVSPLDFLKKRELSAKEVDDLIVEINRKLIANSDELNSFKPVLIPAAHFTIPERYAIIKAFENTSEWKVTEFNDNGAYFRFQPLLKTNNA